MHTVFAKMRHVRLSLSPQKKRPPNCPVDCPAALLLGSPAQNREEQFLEFGQSLASNECNPSWQQRQLLFSLTLLSYPENTTHHPQQYQRLNSALPCICFQLIKGLLNKVRCLLRNDCMDGKSCMDAQLRMEETLCECLCFSAKNDKSDLAHRQNCSTLHC